MVTESKRYHPTKFTRFVIYPIVFTIFIFALSLLLIMAKGFSFSFKDGKISILKTGMIITNSRPTDGTIFLDGKKYNKRTSFSFLPVKITSLLPGEHSLVIKKDGFRTWQNNITVRPNLVSWVNYVLLFPNDLKIEETENLKDKQIITSSKNHRFLLVRGKEEAIETLFAYDQNNGSLNKIWPKAFIPSEEWLKNPIIISAEFNQNNDKILLGIKNGEAVSYAILETANGGKIYSIATLPVVPEKIVWSAADGNELFVLSKNVLYRTNTERLAEVQELTTNVIDFVSERNRNIYYVSKLNEQGTLSQISNDGSRKEILQNSVKLDTDYKISYSSQLDAVALLPINDKILTVFYRNNGKMASIELSKDITNYKWSGDGRSLFYYNGKSIKNFNWDEEKETVATQNDKIVSVDWYFDENHYLVQTEKEFYVIDFDNTNKVVFSEKPIGAFFPDPKYSSFLFNSNDIIKNYKFNSFF